MSMYLIHSKMLTFSLLFLIDMGAFKAANPGCTIGDFIRWHSPKDWDEKKGQMSARMADSGNFWQELWEVSSIPKCFLVVNAGVDKRTCSDPMLLYL